MSRLIDADALIDDLKHDVAMDQDSLDYEELTDSNREMIQFDKDCKQNAIDLLQNAPTIEPQRRIPIYTQNRQAVWNYADISRFHVTGNGTGIQAVAKNGAGGELARYKNREQCTFVLGMLMAALESDDRTFTFPTEREIEHAKQHGATGGGKRHGGS